MPFSLTTQDKGQKPQKKPPLKIAEELEVLGKRGQQKYRPDWVENMEQIGGFLDEATLQHQVRVVGGNLLDTLVNQDRYGDPCPFDILRPTMARYLGRNLSLFGGAQGIPTTSEQEDIDQAEAVEKVMQNKWDNEDLDIACMNASVFVCGCSHGYLLIEGDNTLLEPERFQGDELGFENRELKVGDVVYEALGPMQVFLPPGTQKLQDAEAVLVIQFKGVEEIRRRWPELETDQAEVARYETRFDELVPGLEQSMIKVKRLFIKGNPQKNPKGEQYVIIGKGVHIVKDEKKDRWIGTYDNKYPLVDFYDEPFHVGYYGRGRHTSARPALKVASSMWTKIATITALPLMIGLPDGSGVGVEDLADVPFIIFNMLPGTTQRPEFIGPKELEWYFRTMDTAAKQIAEVYQQHEPSRGKSPGSRFSAEGIKLLQGADRMGDSVIGKITLKAMTRVLQRVLGEGLEVWPEEYAVTVLGRENSYQRHILYKAQLKPGMDVRVIPGSEEPKTRNAMMRELTEAVRYGMLDGPEARRIMGAQRREDLYNPQAHHIRKIKMEDLLMQHGKEVDIFPEDDHLLHIEHHEKRQIERAFEAEPEELESRRAHNWKHIREMQPEPMALPPGNTPQGTSQGKPQQAPAQGLSPLQ